MVGRYTTNQGIDFLRLNCRLVGHWCHGIPWRNGMIEIWSLATGSEFMTRVCFMIPCFIATCCLSICRSSIWILTKCQFVYSYCYPQMSIYILLLILSILYLIIDLEYVRNPDQQISEWGNDDSSFNRSPSFAIVHGRSPAPKPKSLTVNNWLLSTIINHIITIY